MGTTYGQNTSSNGKKKKRRKFNYYLDCIEYNFDSLLRKEN